ncbi:conserved hypothetical protein [Leishmania major strain Friedlin]|uniref:AttH domain-containing protein n=1 Tax=Leishmania major TaxID=5664 RepID=E9AFD1_LEIMA|nr:conserved hypothetical protein [Leishmania major strain Friedlin]CAG9582661.1 hypothetical_protein_-_conserved [Leishmania major strain Friedlin]CBZ12935.1 conserved hypothetical protein [Leishmania major strain Friedlin]|eukprot:XP_003722701.1 conserved hypothetical protein [Leishmania major strain Friedlin]
MHFPAAETAVEPPVQRQRFEDESVEEKSLKERLRNSWPQLSVADDDGKGPSVSASALWSMLLDHDRAHEHCQTERWTLRSRFGAHNRFALCVTFHSVAVVSDVDPPKEDSLLTHACVVNWSITDHEKKKYYRFCAADDRAPALFSMMVAKKTIQNQPAMLQAMLEQFNNERLVLPDQLLDEAASTRLTELDVQFGKNTLKAAASAANRVHQLLVPRYTLHLEGVSSEHEESDLSKEVRAVVDLTFMPRSIPPALGGTRGIVSTGNWEDDEFSYCLHHTRLLGGSLRVTRASDNLELARDLEINRGSMWMEHSFGGVVPRSVEEARFMQDLRRCRLAEETDHMVHDHCLIRLYDKMAQCFSITRVMSAETGAVKRCDATVHSAASKEAFQHNSGVIMSDETDESYMSSETGVVYPTRWRVECPASDGCRVELHLAATLPNQEMITCLAQPSEWEGTVTVTGKLIMADGSVTEVRGDGFVTSRGRGKLRMENDVFGMLHGLGSAAMKRAEVAAAGSWEAIAEGPGLVALAGLKVALKMQQFHLTLSQQMVLAALLGTYGYIYHHPQEVEEVKKALQWCYNRWMTFYGASAINYRTLTLRAFIMQELCDVAHAKCAAWIQKRAQALDIAVPVSCLFNSDVADSCVFSLPARCLLLQPPSMLEVSQIKALMAGTWVMDPEKTEGSMNAVLLEQGVNVLLRSVNSKTVPTWVVHVNCENKIVIDEVTMLERRHFVIALDGTEWTWESVSRDRVKSRSCVLSGGRELYVETEVQEGIERVWYQFQDGDKTMVQNIFYFTNPTTSTPVASCKRHFKIQLPPGSPTSAKK